jgi:hypothetical protein
MEMVLFNAIGGRDSLASSGMDDAGWEILSMLDVRSLPYAIVSFAILFSNIICQPAPNE